MLSNSFENRGRCRIVSTATTTSCTTRVHERPQNERENNRQQTGGLSWSTASEDPAGRTKTTRDLDRFSHPSIILSAPTLHSYSASGHIKPTDGGGEFGDGRGSPYVTSTESHHATTRKTCPPHASPQRVTSRVYGDRAALEIVVSNFGEARRSEGKRGTKREDNIEYGRESERERA